MRRATPARLGLSCRRAGSPSGRPRSAAPSGSADSRPRGLRRSGGLAPHRAAPRVPAEARRPGPRDGRGTQPRAPWTSGRPSLAGAASSSPRRQDGRRRVGAAGLRRAPRGHQLAQPEPGRPAPAHGQRGRHGPALERRGRPVLRPAARYAPPRPPLPQTPTHPGPQPAAARALAGRVLRGAGPARGAACDRGQRAKGRPLRGRRSLVSPLREIISTTKVLTNKKKSHLRRCAFSGPTPWRVTSDQTHLSGQSGRGPGLVRCGSAKHDSAQSSRYCYPTGAGRETEARG